MDNYKKRILGIVMVILVVLCRIPPASAADATSVFVNGVELNAAAPYWANGSPAAAAAPPAGGWNAYFDAAASSLTLQGATLDTMYEWSASMEALVYANGDIAITLLGDNRLHYAADATSRLYGIQALGNVTISGSGSADILIHNTSTYRNNVYGVASQADLVVQAGALQMDLLSENYVYGFYADKNISYQGGTTVVSAKGYAPRGAYASSGGYFRMTGGTLTGLLEVTFADARGIYAGEAYLEGGTGSFFATGVGVSRGLLLLGGPLHVSGGFFRFSGEGEAITINKNPYVININPALAVYVSDDASGAGMWRWTSVADGALAGDEYPRITSSFRYVQFGEASAAPVPPRTGDASNLWLWTGIALFALLSMAGTRMILRRRQA